VGGGGNTFDDNFNSFYFAFCNVRFLWKTNAFPHILLGWLKFGAAGQGRADTNEKNRQIIVTTWHLFVFTTSLLHRVRRQNSPFVTFDMFRRVITCFDMLRHVWTCHDMFWHVLTRLDISKHAFTCLYMCGHVKAFLAMFRHVLKCMDIFVHVWTCSDVFEQLWTC